MKLAFLVHGGLGRSIEERTIPALAWLVERLAREHQVHVFTREQDQDFAQWTIAGAHVHNIGLASGRRRRLLATFQREHAKAPFAAIQGVFGWGGSWGAALGWRHRVPATFHAAGGEFVALPDIGYGTLCSTRGRVTLGVATRGARTVTVATHAMRELAEAHGTRAIVAPLGVDLAQWPAAPPRARPAGRPARLLHVGDIRPVKDQLTLLRAVRDLVHSGADLTLDMAGLDTLDGSLQRTEIARELGARVRWHGVLSRATLRQLMERSDLLLVSSRHEAGPLVVLEAAVAGIPCVGTAVGHIKDWSPEAAVAVPVGDWRSLAGAVADLLASDERRLAIAREAQHRALGMDVNYTAARFNAVYEGMLQ